MFLSTLRRAHFGGVARALLWGGSHLPLLASCALLAWYRHPPALDWPQHQAVGAILWALIRQDPCVTAHYAFALQPTPYHLLYLVLTPSIAAFGPRWGSTCVLILMACATHLALRAFACALGRHRIAATASPLLFFSGCFAWGFGPTLMGLAPCLMALAALVALYDARTSHTFTAVKAGAWGAVAVSSHGIYLGAIIIAVLPQLWPRGSCFRQIRAAVTCTAISALPALPLVARGCLRRVQGMATSAPWRQLTFESLATGWDHFRLFFAAFDKGLCRTAQHALLVLAALLIVGRLSTWRREERAVLIVTLIYTLCVWLVPLDIALHPAPAWLLNVRFLPLAEAALLVIAMPQRPLTRLWHKLTLVMISCTFVCGLAQAFANLDQTAAYVEVLRQTMPDNLVLPARGGPRKFYDAWPAIDRHLISDLVPQPVCFSYNLFLGGHFPICKKDHLTEPDLPYVWRPPHGLAPNTP